MGRGVTPDVVIRRARLQDVLRCLHASVARTRICIGRLQLVESEKRGVVVVGGVGAVGGRGGGVSPTPPE